MQVERCADWEGEGGKEWMNSDLEATAHIVLYDDIRPDPVSACPECPENLANRIVQHG